MTDNRDEVFALVTRRVVAKRARAVWMALLDLHPILKRAAARVTHVAVARALSVFENITEAIVLENIDRQVPRAALAAHMEAHRNGNDGKETKG